MRRRAQPSARATYRSLSLTVCSRNCGFTSCIAAGGARPSTWRATERLRRVHRYPCTFAVAVLEAPQVRRRHFAQTHQPSSADDGPTAPVSLSGFESPIARLLVPSLTRFSNEAVRGRCYTLRDARLPEKRSEVGVRKYRVGNGTFWMVDEFLTSRVLETLEAQPRHIKSEWVFTNPETEEAWKDIRKAFRRACKAAKLYGRLVP